MRGDDVIKTLEIATNRWNDDGRPLLTCEHITKITYGKKVLYEDFGEMLFTHFGVSGPVILSASSFISKELGGEPLALEVDLKPALSLEQLDGRILRDFEGMKRWYDGYVLDEAGYVYNPNSVMKAIRSNKFHSYWTETSAAKSLMGYISLDFDGLSVTIAKLLGGISVPVDTNGFANDLSTFQNQDDVLTLLIHLGYLAYDEETGKVRIPNEEIRLEFARAIREVKRDDTIRRVQESEQLIYDTVHKDADAVAAQVQKIHMEESAILFYNDEQALRSVIKLAYFSYRDYYIKFEELPAGEGYADIVNLLKKASPVPALVIELKWNHSAKGAIDQIREKKYSDALKGYGGDILLVGIGYDKDVVMEPFVNMGGQVTALTHKFNFIFLSYKNITFLTAFSWFSESQGIVSP